jgi:group I intron endonuclease
MIISAIYSIQSTVKPERFYIGSAVNIFQRWKLHSQTLKKGIHRSKKLQYHFNKYGESDLKFIIIIQCDKENLIKTEQIFIDLYNPYFNTCKIAGSQLGLKRSINTKIKMSKSKIGHKYLIF